MEKGVDWAEHFSPNRTEAVDTIEIATHGCRGSMNHGVLYINPTSSWDARLIEETVTGWKDVSLIQSNHQSGLYFSEKLRCILGRSRDRTDTILRPLFVQQREFREFTSNSTRFSYNQQASMRMVLGFLRAGATVSIALRIWLVFL